MRKEIFRDKFAWSILLVYLFIVSVFKSPAVYWFVPGISFFIMFSVFSAIVYFKEDFYLHSYMKKAESFEFKYQKNFSKRKIHEFSLSRKSIASVDFSSNSFPKSFHKISIKYLDENGHSKKKTLKILDDATFIQLLYKLKFE